MLDTSRVETYLTSVREFADRTGQRANLEENLAHLARLFEREGQTVRTRLLKDFAPQSFEFVTERQTADGSWDVLIVGGLIYHGKHDNGGDGGAPTFAVSLSPCDGWSLHT